MSTGSSAPSPFGKCPLRLQAGTPAISPATFAELSTPKDFKQFADRVREISGGVPVGFKMSANHIERDIEFALQASADYIILDGRGGGTGQRRCCSATISACPRCRHWYGRATTSTTSAPAAKSR
jgi:hypothetical protein